MLGSTAIGRQLQLDELLGVARAAAEGRGSVVFLEGPTGSGKSFLLAAFAQSLAPEGEVAPVEVVSYTCRQAGGEDRHGPFVEMLAALTDEDRRGDRAKRWLKVIGDYAPDLLELLVPGGKVVGVAVKTATGLGVEAMGGDHESQKLERADDVTRAFVGIAADSPLAVVLDNAQWIDEGSIGVVERLADGIDGRRLLLLVAYDPEAVDGGGMFARVRATILGSGQGRRMTLDDLTLTEVESILEHRYGTVREASLAAWLLDRSDGNPRFLEQHLATLEEQGVLRRDGSGWTLAGTIDGEPGAWRLGGELARAQMPGTLVELLRPRVALLEQDDKKLLQYGSVQGLRFLSMVVVALAKADESDVEDRLAELEQTRRMITAEETDDWFSDHSTVYAFDPSVLQELLYDDRYAGKGFERRKRHREVAGALEALLDDGQQPPRLVLLEIARHYEEAGDKAEAGRRLADIAASLLDEGADKEAAATAERAIALLRDSLDERLDDEKRTAAQASLARALILFLLGGEPGWQAEPERYGGTKLLPLADEAERLAADVGLRANACFAKARVLTAYGELPEAIAVYRSALELARAAKDETAEFAILLNLGHHLDSVSLEQGRAVLEQAHALLSGPFGQGLAPTTLAYETGRLESRLGVADFDLGRYGEAIEYLVRASEALKATRRREEAAWALCFLGQQYTAIGLYEEAEQTLREAIALFGDEPKAPAVRGYLRSLVGRLFVQWEPPRLEQAREELTRGREEALASGSHSIRALVDSYWAELLLAEGTPDAVREADEVLSATATHGWARGEIATSSLRARVALAQGNVDEAVTLSTHAVDLLTEHEGAVPAVRSEEILLTHARILEAARSDDASRYAADAAAIVRAKADSLPDEARRRSFLERVRVSRDVLAAAEQ
ncbi:MAG TPA: AAA family ATPase [Gaiellaceae bacterium]|nr:AAA family ATPase [Gaiellaceae bacterium]